jgi:hypothetical protein
VRCVQINLQPHFGGGEVYTAFLCRALSQLGVPTRLLVHPAPISGIGSGCRPTPSASPSPIAGAAASLADRTVVAAVARTVARRAARRAAAALAHAIAHMPVQGRNPAAFAGHDRIYAVSGWVRDGLWRPACRPGTTRSTASPTSVPARGDGAQSIRRTSRYDWDRRKGRDRLLGLIEPLVEMLRPHPASSAARPDAGHRLAPDADQAVSLAVRQLAPVLARRPRVNLEIFGSGGYASVRDLDRALAIAAARQVRFWGQQSNVGGIYRQLDYLLSGLPEKEALGLNIIEAQACGTPVIAVHAPPFTETVSNGATGFLYRDPREDAGADFARLMDELLAGRARATQPELAQATWRAFSFDAFVERLRPVVADARAQPAANKAPPAARPSAGSRWATLALAASRIAARARTVRIEAGRQRRDVAGGDHAPLSAVSSSAAPQVSVVSSGSRRPALPARHWETDRRCVGRQTGRPRRRTAARRSARRGTSRAGRRPRSAPFCASAFPACRGRPPRARHPCAACAPGRAAATAALAFVAGADEEHHRAVAPARSTPVFARSASPCSRRSADGKLSRSTPL